jgi:outer membrane protein assembly factor BamB
MSAIVLSAPVPGGPPKSDWVEFRGPDGTGHYTGPALPTAWGPETNVAWKADIPGKGWSSPILVSGKLILTTAVPVDGGAHELRAVAVAADTGKVAWEVKVFDQPATAPKGHAKNSHASPTPVSDGERVIVHFGHMGTACLDLTGKELWKSQVHTYKPTHGNGGSPILVGDTVVFSCDGSDKQFVVALDKKTGKEVWNTDRKSRAGLAFSFATPQLIEHDKQKQLVSAASDFVAGYDPTSGKELWRATYPKPGWSLITRPVYGHGLVFISTGYVNQHLIAVKPEGTGDITKNVVWSMAKNAPNTPTPLLAGDELYVISDNGFATCVDAKTGKVHWSQRLKGKAFSSSPILAGGKVYITSEDGVGTVFEATKAEYKEVTTNDMKERTFATFLPADGALYLRTETKLFKFVEKK